MTCGLCIKQRLDLYKINKSFTLYHCKGGDFVRKRIICVILCAVLLFSSCCVTAFAADNSFDFFDFYFTYCNSIFYKDGIASDPDRLVDFYSTDAGKTATLFNMFRNGGVLPAYIAKKSLDGAVDARYIAAQVDKDMVEQIYSDAALIAIDEYRTYGLDELHLSTGDNIYYSKITVSGSIPVTDAGSSWTNSSKYKFGNAGVYSVSTPVETDTVYCYPGGALPPMFYVPANAHLYQDGVLLPSGYLYFVLGDNSLLQAQPGYFNYAAYYTGDGSTSNSLTFGITRGSVSSSGYVPDVRADNCKIYSSGDVVGQINTSSYPGWSMTNLFQQMCGFIIDHPNVTAPTPVMPDDIPYDDDDNVVVMVPIDEPGEPVYMSPTEYNNCFNNGDIYNTDDHSNNVVSNDTINNITNIYNTYDDSKILNKLDIIIDKLDKIYNTIKSWKLPKLSKVEPEYDNFSDCIIDNVPIAKDINDLVEAMHTSEAKSGFEQENKSIAGSSSHQEKSIYDGLGVDVSWYEPYRNDIRDLLKLFCYALGIGGIWSAVRSVFGIHSSGGDDD